MSSSCVYPPDPERLTVSTVGSQSPDPASAALPSGTPLTLDPTTQSCCQIASGHHLSSPNTLETEDPDFTSYFCIHPVLSRTERLIKCLSCSFLVKYI